MTLGKVARQIAAIVKDASHFDYAVVTAAIEKKMARLLHPCAAHSGPAQRNVVSPRAFGHDLRTFPSSLAAHNRC